MNDHVGIRWTHSHFLSFTEDLLIAYRYGAGDMNFLQEDIDASFIDYYDTGCDWDFALLTLQSQKINWKKLDAGLFESFFPGSLLKFAKDYNA